MPLDSKHVYLSVVPLSHLLEQTAGFFVPLRFGCKIVYTTSRKSSMLLKAMQEEKVTTIVSVPIILKNFKDKIIREIEKKNLKPNKLWIRLAKKKFGNLKIFPVGGAPLDSETEIFWKKAGVKVLQGYGLTETSPKP